MTSAHRPQLNERTTMMMNDDNTPEAHDLADREALIASLRAGLEELRARPMTVRYRPRRSPATIRHQLYFTDEENRAFHMAQCAAGLAVGRPVTVALIMRTALGYMIKACIASMSDPVAREKLRADVLKAREDRKAELPAHPSQFPRKGSAK